MEPVSAAGIGIGSSFGLLALFKLIRRFLGFKSCKWNSTSNNEKCVFGCVATKKIKKNVENIENKPPSDLSELEL